MAQQHAFGATVDVYDCVTDYAYEEVGYVRNVTPPLSMEATGSGAHDSTAGAHTFVPGLAQGGEMTIELLFDPADGTHSLFRTLITNRTDTLMRITWPDGSVDNWRGLVTGFSPSAPFDDMLSASMTFMPSGFPLIDDADGFSFLAQEDGTPLLTEGGGLVLVNNSL